MKPAKITRSSNTASARNTSGVNMIGGYGFSFRAYTAPAPAANGYYDRFGNWHTYGYYDQNGYWHP